MEIADSPEEFSGNTDPLLDDEIVVKKLKDVLEKVRQDLAEYFFTVAGVFPDNGDQASLSEGGNPEDTPGEI